MEYLPRLFDSATRCSAYGCSAATYRWLGLSRRAQAHDCEASEACVEANRAGCPGDIRALERVSPAGGSPRTRSGESPFDVTNSLVTACLT